MDEKETNIDKPVVVAGGLPDAFWNAPNHAYLNYIEAIDPFYRYREFKYSHLTRKQREATAVPVRDSSTDPKIGRNEVCPCGSGLKYKNCCSKK